MIRVSFDLSAILIISLLFLHHWRFCIICIFVPFEVDPKLGPQRKTAGVRNLPKIDRNAGAAGKVPSKRQQGKASKAFSGKVDFESNGKVEF